MTSGSLAVVLAAHLLGAFQSWCWWGHDLYFHLLGGPDPSPDIVMIDIDDEAIRQQGRWPWDRQLLARIIDTLDELEARLIVLDLLLNDDQPERFEPAAWVQSVENGGRSNLPVFDIEAERVDDDAELAAAMARSGRVILPVTVSYHDDSRGTRHESWNNENASPGVQALLNRFTMSRQEWEAHGYESAGSPYTASKRRAARLLAEQFLLKAEDANRREFLQEVVGDEAVEHTTPDTSELNRAFDEETSRSIWRRQTPATSSLPGLVRSVAADMPQSAFLQQARAIGNVTLRLDEHGDAVLRKTPLLTELEGRRLPHLSLAAAAAALDLNIETARREGGWIVLTNQPHAGHHHQDARPPDMGLMQTASRARNDESRTIRFPVDRRGDTLIPWARPEPGEGPAWRRTFDHLPVTRILEIIDQRDAMDDNAKRRAAMISSLVESAHRQAPGRLPEYLRLVRERNERLRQSALAPDRDERHRLRMQADAINNQIADIEQRSLSWLDSMLEACEAMDGTEDDLPEECLDAERFAPMLGPPARRRLDSLQTSLEKQIHENLAALKPVIRGRICIVGVVATGVPDFVAGPLDAQIPGCAVHAHLLSALLSGHSIRSAPAALNIVLILVAGVFSGFATGRASFLTGVVMLALCFAAVGSLAALQFTLAGRTLDWPVMLLAAAFPWVGITSYRRVMEERGRRRLTQILGQYTSAPIAARLAHDVDATQLDPRRCQVTCFFSDLADFTAASERLNPEEVRDMLQPYLATVSRVLIERRALVNKFIGDGVFGFFNAPVMACENHAGEACRAALEVLAQLSTRQTVERVSTPSILRMRIGLATGSVLVGDFGTAQKRDYTALGDVVNVAARLEAANKAFQTYILANDATRQQAGTSFLWRHVGCLYVAGRAAGVIVHELKGFSNDSLDGPLELIAMFEDGLRHFVRRDWSEARRIWLQCARMDPTDGVVRFYLDRLDGFERREPAPQWSGEVRIESLL